LLCHSCAKKVFCSQLCPEAEAYANQDHVTAREYFQFSEPQYTSGLNLHEEYPSFTKTEWKIIALMKRNFTREEVCAILDISRQNLRTTLSKMKARGKGLAVLLD
jgi:DNA-binding CsgD family transcriptional regulator